MIRVTDKLRFDTFKQNLMYIQKSIARNQDMVSAGKKILDPSDDSVVFSKNVEIQATKQLDVQFQRNLGRAKTLNSLYETSLTQISDLLAKAEEIAVSATSETSTAETRRYASEEIKGIIEHLVTVANSKLGNTYIFSGKKLTTTAFTLNADYTVDFNGSNDVQQIYVDAGERSDLGLSGNGVFYTNDAYAYYGNSYTGSVYSNSYYKTDNSRFLVNITGAGVPGTATYQYSTDGGTTWNGSDLTTATISATASQYVIDGTNNKIVFNDGTSDYTVTIGPGTYTADGLAAAIKAGMEGATAAADSYSVTYDAATGKFAIRNDDNAANPGTVTLKWSDANSTAAGILGFDTVDKEIGKGKTINGDYLGGMFIDGAGVANSTNKGTKMVFGATGTLAADDKFLDEISAFDVLKKLKDGLESDDTDTISETLRDLKIVMEEVEKNLVETGTFGNQIDSLINEKSDRATLYDEITAEMMDSDLGQLTVDFNTLTNTYQALIYAMSKMQSMTILNYLK
ncbi:MAG: Flagellar hook-associated protein 3 [Syntrophorhabdus sp. PtaU1.Bin058]|nr:MAG: Flagellar hook-associated protein 3 [Syntrophorhabdus sp. PtaU1.Bin058]